LPELVDGVLNPHVPDDVADHVYPRSLGGPDRWSNLGAACFECNISKQAKIIELTPQQQSRLDTQHASLRVAFDAIDRDRFWLAWFGREVKAQLDDYDPEDLDEMDNDELREEIQWNLDIETHFEEYPKTPREAVDRVLDLLID
jgi:hypothetical protein